MKLKDLEKIANALHSLGDFAESNTTSDESGIGNEMASQYNEAIKIVNDARYRIYLRNAKAEIKRKKIKNNK